MRTVLKLEIQDYRNMVHHFFRAAPPNKNGNGKFVSICNHLQTLEEQEFACMHLRIPNDQQNVRSRETS